MSKIIVVHKCKYENGKIVWFNPELLTRYLSSYKTNHFDVSFRQPSRNRTLPQNQRHWARMTFAANVLGDRTPEELHYDFCNLLLVDRTVTPARYRTTKDLTTEEFSKFEESIDRELASLGIAIPEPGEEFSIE